MTTPYAVVGLITFSIFYVFIFNVAVANVNSWILVFAIVLSITALDTTSFEALATPQLIIF